MTDMTQNMDKPVSLWRDAWDRLVKNKLAVIGLVMVLVLFFAAVLWPLSHAL